MCETQATQVRDTAHAHHTVCPTVNLQVREDQISQISCTRWQAKNGGGWGYLSDTSALNVLRV